MTSNSVVTLSQVISIVEEACSTVNSNINKKVAEGGGGANLASYEETVQVESFIYDDTQDLYYYDLTHNLNSVKINITVSNDVGASYAFAVSLKLANSVRIWIMEADTVKINIIAL